MCPDAKLKSGGPCTYPSGNKNNEKGGRSKEKIVKILQIAGDWHMRKDQLRLSIVHSQINYLTPIALSMLARATL
jgi:hypothetical protein